MTRTYERPGASIPGPSSDGTFRTHSECNPYPRRFLYLRWEEARRLPPLDDGSSSPFRRFMDMPIVTPKNPCGPSESVDTHDGVRLTCQRRCRNVCPFADLQGAA